MDETELLATMQVFFVLLCAVLVFSLICTIVEAIREYRRTRVVRHTAKHSRGPEVPVSHMVVPKSDAAEGDGVTGGMEYTQSMTQGISKEPQGTVGGGYAPNAPQESNSPTEETKQTPGYSRAPRKRHARHGR